MFKDPLLIGYFGVIGLYLLFQLFWYGRFWIKLRAKKEEVKLSGLPPLSVIVAARNESNNLMKLIPELFYQDYPNFEVVVIDDCSYDNTTDVLIALKSKYPKLKTTFIKESNKFQGGKKFALTIGIKSAKNEHLVFTDADCKPSSKNWLKSFGEKFSKGNNLVIGFGGFLKSGSLVNALQRVDGFQIALDYFSAIIYKSPYMAVGRNMGYTKKLFFDHKGFAKSIQLKSGDDDLFVNQVGSKAQTDFILEDELIAFSAAKSTFKEWFNQKKRHVSTFKFYKAKNKILVSFLQLFKLLIYFSFTPLLFGYLEHAFLFIAIFIGLWIIRFTIYYLPAKKMKLLPLMWLMPVLEPVIIILQLIFPIIRQFDKEISWKH